MATVNHQTGALGLPNGTASFSDALRDYEPKPSIPMALKPVSTPATNPDAFKQDTAKDRAKAIGSRLHQATRAGIPPGCKLLESLMLTLLTP